ncbi:hypothetical protein SBC1_80850 (plasmid) [Caballeronia sp. SBC1]|uniref:hypothetical protein n=1 Tax=Caballeronia sp. SBC1 TaxID=2705548 RepID=UPI0014088909|nr:hypothetical protein [Caballeronia sp. SBC1]QIN68038.1 hypothetical protein SBC1_80850 [Caballeronia sp. SBC1]
MSKILRVALGLMVASLLTNASFVPPFRHVVGDSAAAVFVDTIRALSTNVAQSTGAETLIPITVTLFYVGLALLIVEAAHMAVLSTGQCVRHVVSSVHSRVFPGRSM